MIVNDDQSATMPKKAADQILILEAARRLVRDRASLEKAVGLPSTYKAEL